MKDLQRYGSIKVRAWDPFLAQCFFTDVYMRSRHGGKDTPIAPGTFSYTYDPPIYEVTSGCKVTVLFWREAPRWTPVACVAGAGLFFRAKEEVSRAP